MDTHITHLEPEPLIGRSARLPDEPDLELSVPPSSDPAAASTPDTSASVPARKRKRGLLARVSLGAVVVLGGGAFLLSPLNTIVPVPPSVTALAGQSGPSVAMLSASITHLAGDAKHAFASLLPESADGVAEPGATPAASSARAPSQKPTITTQGDPIVAPAASMAATHVPRRPDSIVAAPYEAHPREQSLTELLRLRGDTKAAADGQQTSSPVATTASATPAPITPTASNVTLPSGQANIAPRSTDAVEPGFSPSKPAAATKPQQADITSTVTQAALGQGAAAAPAEVAPIPAATMQLAVATGPAAADVKPVSAVSQAVVVPDIKADAAPAKAPILVLAVPAGHQEQAEVLQYVTGLSGEVARLRTENETLRKDVARRIAEQDGRMADFNRRVSIAEARAALRSAADAGKSDSAQAEPVVRVASAPAVTPVAQGAAPRSPSQPAAVRPRYHVQAASPGLALLAEVGRGGGDGAQLQVAVGDQVPGYGVVKSVAQRGPNWVVQTEHGPID